MPNQYTKPLPPEERFWPKVQKTETCWLWTGFKRNGYGHFWVRGRLIQAHRFAYELLVGPIPTGLTLDHLCRNRSCVNPKHLEAVSMRTNILRGNNLSARYAQATHCVHGHPFDLFNTLIGRKGQRRCRACHRAEQRKYRGVPHPHTLVGNERTCWENIATKSTHSV